MEKRTLRGVETIRRFGDDPRKTRARRLAERESYGLAIAGLIPIHPGQAVISGQDPLSRSCTLR